VVEILIDPIRLENYQLRFDQVVQHFSRNNQLVTAGNLETADGRFAIKVPGVLESATDIMNLPITVYKDAVIRLADIAEVRKTFKDPEDFARDRGLPAVTLEISKRTGENLIETIEGVKKVVQEAQKHWPSHIHIGYSQDESNKIRTMLLDLQNNIIFAIILVMAVIIAALGWRSALLVGLAVPGSFLMGIMVISLLGHTINIVVLFSLIFAVGMLVDGAIIVVEYADRKMAEGLSPKESFKKAAERMAWPVITSISTILVVFLPLLFWPGVVGQFMKFMPITLLATLIASILMALIFIPAIGSLVKRPFSQPGTLITDDQDIDIEKVKGWTGKYLSYLSYVLEQPKKTIFFAIGLLVFVKLLHSFLGKGVEFFPNVEPDMASIHIHARGNLSIYEKDDLVKIVEKRLLDMEEFETIYSRSGSQSRNRGEEIAEDVIGVITLELVDWQKRRSANLILEDVEKRTQDIPGLFIEVRKKKPGPPAPKPIVMEISSWDYAKLKPALEQLRAYLESVEGLVGVEDNSPIPGIEWKILVDRAQAAKFNADVATIGMAIRLVTNGTKVATYRPDDARDEVDIVVRYFDQYRSLDYLDSLRVQTLSGLVPISYFTDRQARPKISAINRVDGRRVFHLKADVAPHVLVADKVQEIQHWLKTSTLDPDVVITFKGEEKDRKEAGQFLLQAFGVALFLIAIILVTQFNSFFSMALVLSAVIMSTVGIFIGLLIHNLAFGIVMGGIGVIALAGIIVSNNIILIDTYDLLVAQLQNPTLQQIRHVILKTCAQRLRPVILTKLTTILGLLPIMFGINIDFIHFEITQGSPSTQWWTLLSTCIVYGVLFASGLTLFITPSALMIRAQRRFKKYGTYYIDK
ncbi:MAG: efflux RND transporter permease subunit, partial [Proteobacteria bacterium]|nr:efflux RND transporter permease subunit [Pseudomonadota bacterium]